MKFVKHEVGSGKTRGLWLHGWLGSGKEGQHLHAGPDPAFSLICPDLPGHGETPLEGWTLEHTLSGIAELASTCAWAGGYSMGGRLLMMAAERFPDAFKTLVIESASLGIPEKTDRSARILLDQQRGAKLKKIGLQAFYEEWIQMDMWGEFTDFPQKQGNEKELADALELFSMGHQLDLRPWITSAPQKILWIAGKRDRTYAEQAEWVKQHTRHQVELVDAGHNVHLQCGEDWGNAVLEFLKAEAFLN